MASKVGESKSWLSFLPLPDQGLKALYTQGSDQRFNLFEKDVPVGPVDFKRFAKSVAGLVESKYLVPDATGQGYKFTEDVKTLSGRFLKEQPLDPATPFKDELTPAFATAFYIGDQLAFTAGHCVCVKGTNTLLDISKISLVFGFYMEDATKYTPLLRRTVCQIKIIDYCFDKDADYALIKLDKVPKDATPLRLDFFNVIQDSLQIGMLGHPSGLPQKFVVGMMVAKEREVVEQKSRVEARIGGFAGNSGSPVFNFLTGEVVGIFLSGNEDYDKTGLTVKLRHFTPEEAEREGYESCQRLTALPQKVIGLISSGVRSELEETIQKCLDAIKHINRGEKKDAIELLQSLADKGVYAAYCALAALEEDSSKKEQHKQAAVESGFFSPTTIDDVITSVLTMGLDSQSSQAVSVIRTVNVEKGAIGLQSVIGGGKQVTDTLNIRGTHIFFVGGLQHQESLIRAALPSSALPEKPEEKKQ